MPMQEHDEGGIVVDEERIDDAVLALLPLGLNDYGMAWKGLQWPRPISAIKRA